MTKIMPYITPYISMPKMIRVKLYLGVARNTKHIRHQSKDKAREEIERFVLSYYDMEKLETGDQYHLTISYETEEELDTIIYQEIMAEAGRIAEERHGSTDVSIVALDDPDRIW